MLCTRSADRRETYPSLSVSIPPACATAGARPGSRLRGERSARHCPRADPVDRLDPPHLPSTGEAGLRGAFVKDLVDERYEEAIKGVLVVDDLNTHTPASLYDAFSRPTRPGG